VANRVIAIDGPAGSGKSTVARAVADRLGLEYLDTGAMYRGVAFAVLRRGVDPGDVPAVADVARSVALEVTRSACIVDGEDASVAIRGAEVTTAVTAVAANPEVRAEMVARQRAWVAERGGGVMEGRDIGSVVFPEAELKVHLVASPEVRARRRAAETPGLDVVAVAADIRRRDVADSSRAASPLVEASGAEVIDTSDLEISEIVDAIVGLLS
jgi:cytidylate kinase|tara:strand:- start:238 stop:876 length:639 start_codon:yes stop_codon:yes gene_type:complete